MGGGEEGKGGGGEVGEKPVAATAVCYQQEANPPWLDSQYTLPHVWLRVLIQREQLHAG